MFENDDLSGVKTQLELGLTFYEDASTTEPIADEDRQHRGNRNPPNPLFRQVVKNDYLAWVIRRLEQDIPLREIDYHLLGITGCSRLWVAYNRLCVSFDGDIPYSDSEYRQYIILTNKD